MVIELTTADVIHSFWIPALAGKVDMIPGRVNRLVLAADRAGVFRGQCAEFCGAPHALMAFHVVAAARGRVPRLAARARPRPRAEPTDAGRSARDAAAFMRERLRDCHAIRGTDARGIVGPDLTHVGEPPLLAAGTLDNHVGTLAGWIADPQHDQAGQSHAADHDARRRGAARGRGLSREPEVNAAPNRGTRGQPPLPNPLPRPAGELERARARLDAAARLARPRRPSTTPISASCTSATALLFLVLAGVLALVMRTQLAVPGNDLVSPRPTTSSSRCTAP